MRRVEIAVETEPLSAELRARLEGDGAKIWESTGAWKVVITRDVLGQDSVRAQAHVAARDLVTDYQLPLPDGIFVVVLRDPDGDPDIRPDLLIAEPFELRESPEPRSRKMHIVERIGLGGAPERLGQIVYWDKRPLE